MTLLGLYRPGGSVVHRAPVGVKLAVLAALGVVVVVARGPWASLALLAIAVLLAGAGRVGVRRTMSALRSLLIVLMLLGGYQWWRRGGPVAVEVVADLICLVVAATVVTATTPMDALLDTVVRGCRPLRRVGVDPERVALAMALMIRAVPGLLDLAHQTRDAARARGLERNPRALLVPLTLRTVARARATGEALSARGIGDD